jgi:hypothetical protein
MRTINRLRRTSVDKLQPGELFIFSFDAVRRDLVMKLFDTDNGGIYGVLESPSFNSPFTWYAGDVSGACLTYGTDWFLETIPGPETHAGSSFQRDPAHRLFLDKDGSLVWRFQAEGHGFPRALDYAIGDPKERQIDSTAAPIAAFRLWADEADYLNARAHPILSCPSAD